jgi:hypothetical protein
LVSGKYAGILYENGRAVKSEDTKKIKKIFDKQTEKRNLI